MISELSVPCTHAPSPEELVRDRDYHGCYADSGQPCVWAKRFDGVTDPEFHSERVIDASNAVVNGTPMTSQSILETGLI